MARPLLILMLGYPGAGKSTFARLLAQNQDMVRLNSDELRLEMFSRPEDRFKFRFNPYVFSALDYAAREVLRAGQSVIYDANNNHVHERDKTAAIAASFGITTIVVWIQTPFDIARERERQRGTNIPDDAFARLAHALEVPASHERAIAIDGLRPPAEQIVDFQTQLEVVLGAEDAVD